MNRGCGHVCCVNATQSSKWLQGGQEGLKANLFAEWNSWLGALRKLNDIAKGSSV